MQEVFKDVKLTDEERKKVETAMNAVNVYEVNKLNCGLQELQTLNILRRQNDASKRILRNIEEFISKPKDEIKALSKKDSLDDLVVEPNNSFLKKVELSDPIEVNLEDSLNTGMTLVYMTYKSNKLTKIICEEIFNLLTNIPSNEKASQNGKKIITTLRAIHKKVNKGTNEIESEKNIKNLIDIEVSHILDERKYGDDWYQKLNLPHEEKDRDKLKVELENLYHELVPVFEIQELLYEIKHHCGKNLFDFLVNDQANIFEKWGISYDDKGMMIFNIDPSITTKRVAIHIPNERYFFSSKQLNMINRDKKFFMYGNSEDSVRTNNLHQIKPISKETIEDFRTNHELSEQDSENSIEHLINTLKDNIEEYNKLQNLRNKQNSYDSIKALSKCIGVENIKILLESGILTKKEFDIVQDILGEPIIKLGQKEKKKYTYKKGKI